MTEIRYQSPLGTRYASPAMQRLWGEPHRAGLWRRIWVALAEAQRELGLDIPAAALEQMRAHLDDADLALAASYEHRFRHDVMAQVHAFGDQAPAARAVIHLGATSAFVTDNADLLVMRDALRLLLGRLVTIEEALAKFADRTRSLPCLAYTHFQPAQLTTVGKRATLWILDFASDLEAIERELGAWQLLGCKGTTGTQASFLDLFGGDHAKVKELDRRVAAKLGVARTAPVSGQTYSRKIDARVLAVLSGIAQSAAKQATDLRLLQHEGEILEPFESEQIGSSAMAYKRNPMRAERICGLARFVIALAQNPEYTAATQWLERSLDDSANRRLALPEAFLAADAILVLAANLAGGIEVVEPVIARHVAEQMPFMASERWLMLGVSQGGDRQAIHEVIRRHSLAAAEAVRMGRPNDLLERMAADHTFAAIPAATLKAELDPTHYTGRATQQVEEFLAEYLRPLLDRVRPQAAVAEVAEVKV
jgi:adenylosuccinate lyase